MTLEGRLWLIAAVALVACLVLGYAVSHTAQLSRIDVEAAALRGEGVPIAQLFTLSGWNAKAFPYSSRRAFRA